MKPQERLIKQASILPDDVAAEVLHYARYLLHCRAVAGNEGPTSTNLSADLSNSEVGDIWDDEFDDQ